MVNKIEVNGSVDRSSEDKEMLNESLISALVTDIIGNVTMSPIMYLQNSMDSEEKKEYFLPKVLPSLTSPIEYLNRCLKEGANASDFSLTNEELQYFISRNTEILKKLGDELENTTKQLIKVIEVLGSEDIANAYDDNFKEFYNASTWIR